MKMRNLFTQLSKKSKVIIAVCVAIIIFLASGLLVYSSQTSPITSENEVVLFEVVEGDSLQTITTRLEESNIIKNATFAQIDAKFGNVDGFLVGVYEVDRSWTPKQILTYLTRQENIKIDSVMLTFREGMWAKDVANELEKHFAYSADEFIALWNDPTFLTSLIQQYDFLDESLFNGQYRVALEGYLFPETYHFNLDMTKEEITTVFLDHFNTIYSTYAPQIEASQFTTSQWVTLASIVQYESASETDMQNIARVFLNRLDIDMRLESSVTVCYALYEFDSWEQCETEYDIDSAYNTYLNSGLPIGPILNPGEQALKAVLEPADNDYLFFLADVYGDGSVYYSKTFEEHLQKQKQYLGY